MICPNCQGESAHLKILTTGKIVCHLCGGYAETGGVKTDKILTRNAPRITEQAIQHEADLQPPYKVDKSTNQVVVNEDFIDLYPNQAAQTYSDAELKSVGQEGLKASISVDDGKGIEFAGDEQEAIKEIVNES